MCRCHQVLQCGTYFFPATRFEAAVGIDPDLLRWQNAQDVTEDGFKFGCTGNTWGVDIINAGANLVRIAIGYC